MYRIRCFTPMLKVVYFYGFLFAFYRNVASTVLVDQLEAAAVRDAPVYFKFRSEDFLRSSAIRITLVLTGPLMDPRRSLPAGVEFCNKCLLIMLLDFVPIIPP